MREYGVELSELKDVREADCVIVAVAHTVFRDMSLDAIKKLFRKGPDEEKVLLDVKGIFALEALKASGLRYWRL